MPTPTLKHQIAIKNNSTPKIMKSLKKGFEDPVGLVTEFHGCDCFVGGSALLVRKTNEERKYGEREFFVQGLPAGYELRNVHSKRKQSQMSIIVSSCLYFMKTLRRKPKFLQSSFLKRFKNHFLKFN